MLQLLKIRILGLICPLIVPVSTSEANSKEAERITGVLQNPAYFDE